MILRDLIHGLRNVTTSGPPEVEVAAVTADSRAVAPGTLFAAIRGENHDGRQFIPDAITAGATAILAESAPPEDLPATIAWLHTGDARRTLATLAAAFHHHPGDDLKLAGVTGTNGKTTTAFLIHHIMKTVWHRAGLAGTIVTDDGEEAAPSTHTTPGALETNALLARMRDNGCRGAALEVSSHGIHQSRVAGIAFDAAVFTNLTQDHLDYHGTLENYFKAKASWFHDLAADPHGKKTAAIINTDDPRGAELAKALDGKLNVIRCGSGVHADFRLGRFQQSPRGMEFQLTTKNREYLVRAPLIGRFNQHNLVAAIAAASACGIRPRLAINAVANAPQVPGRLEYVGNAGGTNVFVDYAHTPDALENVCKTLRDLNPRRLITIFGCGGDRDKTKRPLMGRAASLHSDHCIITSDNPRSEAPESIIRQIEPGMAHSNHHSIPDRAEAIAAAIANARSGDIILIAGKGHETYQETNGQRTDFDDRKHASKALRDRADAIARERDNPTPRPPRS
jgi:UDP-N-acetylmuramoyl-L-alanyl-D-glutamate--2,6-diaminopimelate ligase